MSKPCIYTVSNLTNQNLEVTNLDSCCVRCNPSNQGNHGDVSHRSNTTETLSDVGSRTSVIHRTNSRTTSLQNSSLSHNSRKRYGYRSNCVGHTHGDLRLKSDGTQNSMNETTNLHLEKCADSLIDFKAGFGYSSDNGTPRKCEVTCEDNSSVSSAHKTVAGIVSKALLSLGLISIACLVLALLAFQLIVSLSQPPTRHRNSLIRTEDQLDDLLEVSVAMVTLVITLDLGCLVVCCMQCFYIAKIMQLPDGDYRSVVYLRQCAGTRFIAILFFFTSIPAFFVALLLYVIIIFPSTPAIISIVILGAGLLLCLATSIQSTYRWRVMKNRADKDQYSGGNIKLYALNHFSTLV